MKKDELYAKLQKIDKPMLKRMNMSMEELKYLQKKVSNDQLGLKLNFSEMDNEEKYKYLVLSEEKELSFNVEDGEKSNLLIEGDNYHALKALKTAGTKVDVIYIDPPYNTGKEFIYNDDFGNNPKVVGNDDAHKHSKWLSFMKKRLLVAKGLMNKGAVIFVSIDDNEQAYLKVLMDEVFGENNFLASVIFDKTSQGTTLGRGFKKTHEYILVFSNSNDFELNYEAISNISKYTKEDSIGKYAISNKLNSINAYLPENRNRGYTIYYNQETKDLKVKYEYDRETLIYDDNYNNDLIKKGYIPIRPGLRKMKQTVWNWSTERLMKDYKTELVFKKDNNGLFFAYHKNRESLGRNPLTIKTFDSRKDGAGMLNKIFGEIKFNFAKPVSLIKWVVDRHKNKNAIILDFFAGSGTTGQAVMELNEEDGGNRRFIMVTNNENDIAKNITRERIYRVVNGKGSKGEEIEWEYSKDKKSLEGNSLKYLIIKPIDKYEGDFEEIDVEKDLYKIEFDKDIDITDFK